MFGGQYGGTRKKNPKQHKNCRRRQATVKKKEERQLKPGKEKD